MSTERRLLPIACTLSPDTGAEQVARWKAFNDDYLLGTEALPGAVVAHYAKLDDAATRLAALVRTEQRCCAFAAWTIDASHADLRLTVAAEPDALDALMFLARS